MLSFFSFFFCRFCWKSVSGKWDGILGLRIHGTASAAFGIYTFKNSSIEFFRLHRVEYSPFSTFHSHLILFNNENEDDIRLAAHLSTGVTPARNHHHRFLPA
jgi:hypothetical protein